MYGAKNAAMGHVWDIIHHMNFAELCVTLNFNQLNTLNKAYALGRYLVILKIPVTRS